MGRTAEKVESLVEENPDMADAVAAVLRETDGGESEVEWADVRNEITSGQWGRMIEKGLLVDGVHGFELRDPEEVRSVVGDSGAVSTTKSTDAGDDEDEDDGWTKWDKAAAGGVALTFLGYAWGPARTAIGSTMDTVIGPLNAVLPFYAVILVLALFTGLYSTLLQANLMDTSKMSEYQEQMKAIQEKRERAKERGDDEAMERIQQEQMDAMGDQLEMFKTQFRPMVWIMLLTIPVFLWMYWKLLDGDPSALGTVTFPLVGEVENWRAGVVGPMEAWIVWYFVCSMAFTQLLRKSLNIRTSPTG
ncbi:DUF106 domain-containing protein [Halalkalicoccus salilacus]|uniref:DUF106 domain-containing protein n=1 Tax=Halalkalicoccus salilacus TaxID=3117459 RepID=UPI00300EAA3F